MSAANAVAVPTEVTTDLGLTDAIEGVVTSEAEISESLK